jgi:hypothetical protein
LESWPIEAIMGVATEANVHVSYFRQEFHVLWKAEVRDKNDEIYFLFVA